MIALKHVFELGRYHYAAATEWSRIRAAESELGLPASEPVELQFELWQKTGGFEVVVGLTSQHFGSHGYLDFFAVEADALEFVETCKAWLKEYGHS